MFAAHAGRQRGECSVQHDRIAQRTNRETMLPVPDTEASVLFVVSEFEVAFLESIAVSLAQERNDELVVGPQPLPIDVERSSVWR